MCVHGDANFAQGHIKQKLQKTNAKAVDVTPAVGKSPKMVETFITVKRIQLGRKNN